MSYFCELDVALSGNAYGRYTPTYNNRYDLIWPVNISQMLSIGRDLICV